MTLLAIYSSPTTPTSASWAEDVTGTIRLGSISALAGEAELGAVGSGSVVLDDISGTVGHASDGIVGLKQFHFDETAAPVGNQRLWTGYVADRQYRRGQGDSLITTVARKIDVTLVDLNSFLSFRVFAPAATDPTSSFVRPAEGSRARIAALLAVDFLSTTLFDIGYVPTTGGVNLDANDYTGSRPVDVLNDIAQANGWNFFVLFDEATAKYVLWMDNWRTDGAATKTYDSALRLTNVVGENDQSVTFAVEPNAVALLDPSRVVSAAYLPYNGGTAYRKLTTTANTFAWRDSVAPSVSVKTLAKANALADRYLSDNSTEDERIKCTVRLPAAKVTGIHEGMRLQVHFTHLPNVQNGFTWTRVLQRTIRQDVETEAFYWLDLELSPIPPVCVVTGLDVLTIVYDVPIGPTTPGFRSYLSAYGSVSDDVASDPDGLTFYPFAGNHYRPAPGAGACGSGQNCGGRFFFRNYGFADATMPTGHADAGSLVSPKIEILVVGPGTATVWLTNAPGNVAQGAVELYGIQLGNPANPTDPLNPDVPVLLSTVALSIPSVTVVVPDDGYCLHRILVTDTGLNNGTVAFGGWDWTPA